MADLTSVEFIAASELAVILLVVGLLIYAAARGFLNSRVVPPSSLALIVTGVVLAVIAAFGGHFFIWLMPALQPPGEVVATSYGTIRRMQWLASNAGIVMIAIGFLIAVKHRKHA